MTRTRASKSADALPTTPDATAVETTAELGSPGLEIYSGRLSEEFLAELSGQKAARIYREMAANDGTVGAILFAISMLIRRASWTIRPATLAAEDEQAAEFLRTCMVDMSHPWGELIEEILSMLVYGFSPHEIVYKRRQGPGAETPSRFDDGLIGWARLPIRSQTTIEEWATDEHAREIRGLYQQAPPRWLRTFIPAERLLLFRPSAYKGNPEGRSILRTAYRSWYFKKHIENFEGVGIERDLAGIPVAWIPARLMRAGATADERAMYATFKTLVTQVRQNEQAGLIMPLEYDQAGNKVFDFTLLSSGSRRQFDTNAIVARYDQRIAMSVLADFILIGHESVGSFALASSKTKMFSTALGAWLDGIQDVLNRQAVPRLFALNPQFRLQALPTFQHGDVETPDLAELGAYISALAGAGVPLVGTELEAHLRRVADLPVEESEER